MGKTVIVQKRGKGGMTYRAHSFNFAGEAKFPSQQEPAFNATVLDFIKCPAHSAPLAKIKYGDEDCLILAHEGMQVGDTITFGSERVTPGNVLPLRSIPDGTLIFNIESMPNDGGKFCRSSGTFARIVSKGAGQVVVRLPSKKQRVFHEECRAAIGIVAGGGRLDKPLLKAGVNYFRHKMKNRLYPTVAGSAMNAVNHPFGNKRTSRHSKKKPVSRHAPPGKKVGPIAARRMGRKR
jgi:large subunit ribosomal protein L2